ncbi:hypothetical protein HGRIS_013148 [Hohenbuehelia grisea]|uniref:Methyltransferase-domain-containing protein n=1 Tax=Hohenbuehelia grisea TaxID=104357 RepID=A0ABR3IUN9_9AGAR
MLRTCPLPAHHTKHAISLSYPFRNSSFILNQRDDGKNNGTALWLGAQCLSAFLAAHHQPKPHQKVIELGSGIGLTALTLAAQGWDVLATDIQDVIASVLKANIERNSAALPADAGSVRVRELDWTVPPDQWVWDHPTRVASPAAAVSDSDPEHTFGPPFDLIVSADTIYIQELVEPLLRTLHTLSLLSLNASNSSRGPIVYICLERRDPGLVDRVLSDAQHIWAFDVELVSRKKLLKAMEKAGLHWERHEWDDVELWKLRLSQNKLDLRKKVIAVV